MSVPDDPFSTASSEALEELQRSHGSQEPAPRSENAVYTTESGRNSTGMLSPPGTSSLGRAGGRRVQWPNENALASHVSIPMVPQDLDSSTLSPHTLEDLGAQEQLQRALEAHSRASDSSGNTLSEHNVTTRFSDLAPLEYPSLAPSTAASSEDGQPDDRYEEARNEMDVFVAPGETDGMPTVPPAEGIAPVDAHAKSAWDLVRAHTSGKGFLRNRKAFKERGLNADETIKSDDGNEKKDGTGDEEGGLFGRMLASNGGNLLAGVHLQSAEDELAASSSSRGAISGGILSSLMALQQAQQDGLDSGRSTPTSSAPPSRRSSMAVSDVNWSDDSEDEEAAKQKFLKSQREKRAKGLWGHEKKSSAATTAAGDEGKKSKDGKSRPLSGTGIGNFIHGRSTAPLPEPPSTSSTDDSKFDEKRKSMTPKPMKDMGHQLKKLGDKLGLDYEHPRPDMARSGGGVFAGLIASTGNIAGVAAPKNVELAPAANRPGFGLSRYSASNVPTLKDLEPLERPRSIQDPSRPSSRNSSRSREGSPQPMPKGILQHTSAPSSPTMETPLDMTRTATTTSMTPSAMAKHHKAFGLSLHALPRPVPLKLGFSHRSGKSTPDGEKSAHLTDYFPVHVAKPETQEERDRREWAKEKQRRKKAKEKRKQEQIFITMHVAAILARQEFILKMARSFMMFGAPSHRLEAQIQATARVLEINCQVVYLPGIMLVSFGDSATHTSETKFLKQANGLDLGKLLAAYYLYWKVIHDKISVTDASAELDGLMTKKPRYNLYENLIIGGLASAFIQPSAFYGSFIDCLIAIPLGALLVLVQIGVSKNDLYSSLFEIVIATINSFLAAAFASTNQFCFSAVASGSVVLILPGYIVLCGALELANRSIISGSVRLVYSVLYSLFLGFGLAMGSEVYVRITGKDVIGADDYQCTALRGDGVPWYRNTIPAWWYFLSIPGYLLLLGLRNGQPFFKKETLVMIIIGSAGWSCNYFSGKVFVNRSDISSAIGSFIVGLLGNIYGKFTRGSPFVVMVVGVLLQLPSGLSNGGLLRFASDSTSGSSTSYSDGFSVAEQLVEVAIGLTVGLFVSAAVVNFLGGGRRRGTNLSSF